MIKYKRKFLVKGDTPRVCTDFKECKEYFAPRSGKIEDLPPCIRDVAKQLNRTWNLWDSMREMQKCPYQDELGKPRGYIVSEMEDGTWKCSCPQWKFRRKECHHIKRAKRNPEKYEIAKEFTGKTTEIVTKLFA